MRQVTIRQIDDWEVIEITEAGAVLHRLPFQSMPGFRAWRAFIVRDGLLPTAELSTLDRQHLRAHEQPMTSQEQAAICLYRASSFAVLALTGNGHNLVMKMEVDQHGPVAEVRLQQTVVYLRCPMPAFLERATIVVQALDEEDASLSLQTKMLTGLYRVPGVAACVSMEVIAGEMTFLQSLASDLSRALRPSVPRHNFTFMGMSAVFILSMSPDLVLEMVETEETILFIPRAGDGRLVAKMSEVMSLMLGRLGPGVTRRFIDEDGNA